MDKLIKLAEKCCEKVEVYSLDEHLNRINFENGRLKEIETSIQSGVALRIIKDNKLGFAYTKNLQDREGLIENALNSLKGGVQAEFDFPETKNLPELKSYDESIEELSNETVVKECERVVKKISERSKGQVNITAIIDYFKIRILNSSGTDVATRISNYYLRTSLLFPNSYASIERILQDRKFVHTPDDYIDYIVDTYNRSSKEVSPPGGRMKVLFLPETLYVLLWRIAYATSAESIYRNASPAVNKIGKKIFHEDFTLINDPLNEDFGPARAFDDEATPTQMLPIIENGVLKNFYYDLNYAQKMNKKSSGNGFKTGRWESEKIAIKPGPALEHLFITPGKASFSEILSSIDQGIIVAGALGAHSGNIPNGDFSIGLAPGLYVKDGRIVGRLKDAMVAGNIYEVLQNVIAVENRVYPGMVGYFPAILFDNVNVASR
ncbi:Zn-dependent protease [candidate division WOR-3 bacterium 4484_100]|uniref:Zn-dependent protease n=1 Tax=candidate division WOR-3 bacterium 4484_100 TaxID=1936077 RepID=A0A1V4QG57_UNCW3|nr:MAG: Zn-dependent protease [candidate division WOR-3 bacterium 4484_100]